MSFPRRAGELTSDITKGPQVSKTEGQAEERERFSEFGALSKVLQAEKLKDGGNARFKQKDFEGAVDKYSRALHKLGDGAAAVESADGIRLACLLNRAACALKLPKPQPEDCVQDCTTALEIDASSAKALFRRGTAFSLMGLVDSARLDLEAALAVKPDDAAITKALAKLDGMQAAAVPQSQ